MVIVKNTKALALFFILIALASVPSGKKVEYAAGLSAFDAAIIRFEKTVIRGRVVDLPEETVLITDRPTLKRIRKIYESMLVSSNGSEPMQMPRFWLQFFMKGKVVDDWYINSRMTSGSELKRNFDLGNCTVENEESIYDSIAEIFAASQAGAGQT